MGADGPTSHRDEEAKYHLSWLYVSLLVMKADFDADQKILHWLWEG